jgi:hypothetical protein
VCWPFNHGSEFSINASTIAFNNANLIGGGIFSSTDIDIKNSIVSNNSASNGFDLGGEGYVSLGYNLIGSDDSNIFSPSVGDIENEDAMLSTTLEVNSGSTATHSLNNGSPAYNAGDPMDNFSDQNDQAIFAGRRDIGAYESQEVLISNGVSTYTDHNILVFPNPTSRDANIEIPLNFGEDISISIYSASSGVLLKEIATVPGKVILDFDRYPLGIYLIKVRSEKFSKNLLISKVK